MTGAARGLGVPDLSGGTTEVVVPQQATN